MNNQTSSEKPKRFLQFGLRQLLVLVAVLSLLFAIVGPRIGKILSERRFQSDLRMERGIQADLEAAVREGDVELARRALDAGADPKQAFHGEKNLLCIAIASGHVEVMEVLLDSGADPEQNSALLVAIESEQPADVRLGMIRRLLQHGADPDREQYGQNAMDLAVRASDAAVGDLLREFDVEYGPREMAAFNRLEELRQAVQQDPSIVQERFEPVYASRPGHGATLLGMALFRGHSETALYLIEQGAPLDTTERLGATHLHSAARGGDPELIRLLVARGLDVNARDDYGDTPLTDSVWNTRPEAIKVLIELGADVNAQGMNEGTALRRAAGSGRAPVVSMLLEAGADPTIEDVFEETPLEVVRKKIKQLLGIEGSPALRARLERKERERQKKAFREIEGLLLDATR